MAVSVTTEPFFKAGTPTPTLEGNCVGREGLYPMYDIASDGQQFVAVKEEQTSVRINVILNWSEELKRLVPTGN